MFRVYSQKRPEKFLISHFWLGRIEKPQDVLKVGEEVDVKITNVDYDVKRISLSIRALLADEPADEVAEEAAAEEPVEEPVAQVAEETAE